ncbi:MAG: hypothetical protein J6O56_02395 [Bacilli bacterium]|nr:hypothetical protein [Bacilli bacterium]
MNKKEIKELINGAICLIIVGIILIISFIIGLIIFNNEDLKVLKKFVLTGIVGNISLIYGLLSYFINKDKLKNIKEE